MSECVCPQHLRMNWQGLNSEEEAEKSRKNTAKSTTSSQVSATWSSRRMSSIPSANCAEQNCIQKHRLGTLLHSNRMEKKRNQDSSLPQRRKCVKYFQKPKFSHELYPLSNREQNLPKNPIFCTHKQRKNTRNKDCEVQGQRKQCTRCHERTASAKDRTNFRKPP